MSSTYSPTLRIELIGDGDQSGIWGQTTNNNLGGLLEQAITGVVTIVMTDANYTLTSYNGVVDEARNAVIVATGTNSAQRNIVAPLVEKTYTIKNSTTGGYAIQIIGSTGTGVVIPNGATASVYCDGTNFYPLQVNTVGNQTINGNLVVTGTTNLQGALTATTATFSGAISSLNPSFTGTPTAPTAPVGTSTTQIATTAFVSNFAGTLGTMSTQNANNVNITGGTIGASVAWGAMPAGTRVMFAQSAAPTGWTQVTDDSANNRMLRVVSSSGGGLGGSYDPTIMNVVPTHTHGYSTTTGSGGVDHTHGISGSGTTSGQSNDHSHSGTTGVESANHSHSGTTGTESANHTHGFGANTGGQSNSHAHEQRTPSAYSAGADPVYWVDTGGNDTNEYHSFQGYYTRNADADHYHYVSGNTGGISNNHTHGFSTGGVSANHTHNVTTGGVSANHTHTWSFSGSSAGASAYAHTHGVSGTTDGGSSQTNWTPRYINMIMCSKN